jgi:hypothetical protein
MKLIDLYLRTLGTTGLDVMDLNSLKASVSNCMADLTSRGYKLFKEYHFSDFEKMIKEHNEIEEQKPEKDRDMWSIETHDNLIIIPAPNDIRKVVYVKLFFKHDADNATRLSLSNPRVQCRYINGQFRSLLEQDQSVFYIKNDKIYIEWDNTKRTELMEISFGYYQKLYCPEDFPSDPNESDKMEKVEINIRREFEDALVLYAAYFYTARYIRDSDKINLTLSNYKYYVEDIIHELSYEDEFNEEDAVIKCEEY